EESIIPSQLRGKLPVMSNLSEPSKEAASADDSSAVQKTGAWSNTLNILLQQASVYGVAAGYCLSASLLSIINKWAVMKFPYPGALTALQYFTSVVGVLLCGQLKLIEHDGLNLRTMWKFLPAAVMFYISIFTNSELLLHANVDTFIVFRSAVPIFVAIGETLYLHQPWPSLKTWLSLSTILGGSVIYVFTDNQFTVTAYTWAVAYLASMSIDFVYIKHVVMTIGLNTWGLVLYNNLEALMLFPLEMLLMGELNQMKGDSAKVTNWLSSDVILPVALSCLFGLSISFFGFSCRRAISATGFTVLGIVNKLLTVVINLLIWDKHASFVGTIGLLICMSGGVLYQQSTTKPKAPKAEPKEENDEEQQKLLEMQQGLESSSTQKQASS
ncbi:Os03g0215000, partial [Oryza sativa Japonica Group]